MKTSRTIKRLSALILAGSIAVLTASADTTSATDKPAAKPHLATAPASAKPRRIYDLGSRSFISNPDYHETPRPARAKQSGQSAEPRRIFNTATRNFEINPDYHQPAGAVERTRRPNRDTEPDRIFDAETGNFEANPAFGIRR